MEAGEGRLRPLLLLALLPAAACLHPPALFPQEDPWMEAPPARTLEPAVGNRSSLVGGMEEGLGWMELQALSYPGRMHRILNRVRFDWDAWHQVWFEWMPTGWRKERDGSFERKGSDDFRLGLGTDLGRIEIPMPGGLALDAQAGIDLFGVSPHGAPEPPRWPGVVEGQDGFYGIGSLLFGNTERSLLLNLGTGLGGIPGRPGRTGRLLGGVLWSEALPRQVLGLDLEGLRLGVEWYGVWDLPGDRDFQELGISLGFAWLDYEIGIGYRRGLNSESEDDAFFLSIGTPMLDALF